MDSEGGGRQHQVRNYHADQNLMSSSSNRQHRPTPYPPSQYLESTNPIQPQRHPQMGYNTQHVLSPQMHLYDNEAGWALPGLPQHQPYYHGRQQQQTQAHPLVQPPPPQQLPTYPRPSATAPEASNHWIEHDWSPYPQQTGYIPRQSYPPATTEVLPYIETVPVDIGDGRQRGLTSFPTVNPASAPSMLPLSSPLPFSDSLLIQRVVDSPKPSSSPNIVSSTVLNVPKPPHRKRTPPVAVITHEEIKRSRSQVPGDNLIAAASERPANKLPVAEPGKSNDTMNQKSAKPKSSKRQRKVDPASDEDYVVSESDRSSYGDKLSGGATAESDPLPTDRKERKKVQNRQSAQRLRERARVRTLELENMVESLRKSLFMSEAKVDMLQKERDDLIQHQGDLQKSIRELELKVRH